MLVLVDLNGTLLDPGALLDLPAIPIAALERPGDPRFLKRDSPSLGRRRGEFGIGWPMEGMPRVARAEFDPGLFHVYARGNRKQAIYLDDRDRRRYLAMLANEIRKTGWRCLTYCLMGNHMHLLVETREPNLGAGMHRFHGAYAQYFNRRHGLSGHLFQSRYDAVQIESDPQLWVTAAYIARNPVTSGLCKQPEDWLWSAHADIVYRCAPEWLDASRLLSFFATDGGQALSRYRAMVALPPVAPRHREPSRQLQAA